MIECPHCGVENAPTRAFCKVCAERLPEKVDPYLVPLPNAAQPTGAAAPPPPGGDSPDAPPDDRAIDLDWLLEEEPGTRDQPLPERPPSPTASPALPPEPAAVDEAVDEGETGDEGEPPPRGPLPSWLSATLEPEPVEDKPIHWSDRLDFTNLPDWVWGEQPAGPSSTATPAEPEWDATPAPLEPRAEPLAEAEGTGLLTGVRGPIPLQPVVARRGDMLSPFEYIDPVPNGHARPLFAQVAEGAVKPGTSALPQVRERRDGILHLLLLLAIILPLIVDTPLIAVPPLLPGAAPFAASIDALPTGSTVLLAFDYSGATSDELDPAAIATLSHLRSLVTEQGTPRELTLLAVSTTPEGPALAERAWAASTGSPLPWRNLGFLSGGAIALRAVIAEQLGPTEAAVTGGETTLLVVLGNGSTDVQRWIEQVGVQVPQVPVLAIAPTAAEAALLPYLHAGQLEGLLAGLQGAASYDIHARQAESRAAQRLEAVAAASLLLLALILAGNLRRSDSPTPGA
jgi:hypothetical protein